MQKIRKLLYTYPPRKPQIHRSKVCIWIKAGKTLKLNFKVKEPKKPINNRRKHTSGFAKHCIQHNPDIR